MTRKFEAQFTAPFPHPPSYVYVSPSNSYQNMFSVSILYIAASKGTFQSASGIVRSFDLKYHLFPSEANAIAWAEEWLTTTFKCTVTLAEVFTERS